MNKIFTFRISTQLHRMLQSLAVENQRSMSAHLRWLIINAATSEGILKKFSDLEDVSHEKQKNIKN